MSDGLGGWLGFFLFFQAEDGIRDATVTGVQTCALPIWSWLPCIRFDYALSTFSPDLKDRKSTRLNSSHGSISYAVFCLKKKTQQHVFAHLLLTSLTLLHVAVPTAA